MLARASTRLLGRQAANKSSVLAGLFRHDTFSDYALVKDKNIQGSCIAEDVLKLLPDVRPDPANLLPHQIALKILASPINPADISCIEGRYPLQPNSEDAGCHPGFEGVAVVEAVGSGVTRFKAGDLAVPIEAFQGTWRTFATVEENHWYRVPQDLPLSTAATLSINPPTALRLLEEFVDLKPGDALVHTAGNSSTGKYIIQLAKNMGIHSISVIRARPAAERQAIEKELKDFGSAMVVTADELADAVRSPAWPHGKPKLGLDCVGGQMSLEVAKILDKNAVLVVYVSERCSTLSTSPPLTRPHASSLAVPVRFLLLQVRRHVPTASSYPPWFVLESRSFFLCFPFSHHVAHTLPRQGHSSSTTSPSRGSG